jgi:hypothetical protein
MYTKSLGLIAIFLYSQGLFAAEPANFSGTLYRRGSAKAERLFNLEAQRNPALWVDHYRDAKGADAVIERVRFESGRPVGYEFDDRQRGGLGSVRSDGASWVLRWEQDGAVKEKRVSAPKDPLFGPLYPGLLAARLDELLAGKKDRGDGSLCVEMKPANWFVALFFPPIDLHLDPKSKRLLNVQGMSLLREKVKGDWQMTEVDLDYSYQNNKGAP